MIRAGVGLALALLAPWGFVHAGGQAYLARDGRHAWAGLVLGPAEISGGVYWGPRWRPIFSLVWGLGPVILTVRSFNRGGAYRVRVRAYR